MYILHTYGIVGVTLETCTTKRADLLNWIIFLIFAQESNSEEFAANWYFLMGGLLPALRGCSQTMWTNVSQMSTLVFTQLALANPLVKLWMNVTGVQKSRKLSTLFVIGPSHTDETTLDSRIKDFSCTGHFSSTTMERISSSFVSFESDCLFPLWKRKTILFPED